MQYSYFDSPIGRLLLAGQDQMLSLLGFPRGKMAQVADPSWEYTEHGFTLCIQQLQEYFAGQRTIFDCPYTITGTPFQQRVLSRVAQVPYGQTVAYSDIAMQINAPKAVRAVGMANARNPLPIIVPCHRIIGKNGALTGFGGGLDVKSFLLAHEKSVRVNARA
jgi:methylated-DNA-[protein]-cysteine S-methyltransferase